MAGLSRIRVIGFRKGQSVLARSAAVTPLVVTDENALFVRANLYDGLSSVPFQFNTVGATMRIDADLSSIVNGNFETAFVGGMPGAGWSGLSGPTLTRNTALPHTVAGCLSVQGAVGVAAAQFDLSVMAGDRWRIGEMWGRKQSTGGAAQITVQNLHTGLWLKSDGTWQTTQQFLLNNATTSYVSTGVIDFVVESATSTMPQEMTLRFSFFAGGGATFETLYDDCYVWPTGLDVSSVHAHNVSQGVLVELVSGTAATPTTVRATLTPRRPAFYSLVSGSIPSTDRFVGIRFSTASLNPSGAIAIGEWVLGVSRALIENQDHGAKVGIIDPQQRETTDAGEQRAYLLTEGLRRTLDYGFTYDGLASFQEARDQLIGITRNGAYPCVVIPDDTDPEVVMFGHFDPQWTPSMDFLNVWKSTLHFNESPLFTLIP